MSRIVVKMKDGTTKDFPDNGAPGGSYCNKLSFDGVFAIIEDAYGRITAIPAQDIAEIKHDAQRRGW